jgi:hypothetical protein
MDQSSFLERQVKWIAFGPATIVREVARLITSFFGIIILQNPSTITMRRRRHGRQQQRGRVQLGWSFRLCQGNSRRQQQQQQQSDNRNHLEDEAAATATTSGRRNSGTTTTTSTTTKDP